MVPKFQNTFARTKKILMVDDEPSTFTPIVQLFDLSKFHIEFCLDPQQAFHKILNNKFDLVILDWNMPVMNGGELIERIELERNKDKDNYSQLIKQLTPFIIYTGEEIQNLKIPRALTMQLMGAISKESPLASRLKLISQVCQNSGVTR
jgi:PleD family two-component response regulator